MTTFGIYLVIVGIIGLFSTMYYIAKGGYTVGPGVLVFSFIWSLFNLAGILFWGTGLGV